MDVPEPAWPPAGVTVNLSGSTLEALQLATELTGTHEIGIINRAVQFYARLKDLTVRGGSIYLQRAGGSDLERLEMF
jgi:hypothetical protein